MKKLVYVILIIIFMSGGIIALANNLPGNEELRISATNAPLVTENISQETPAFNLNLQRASDSFVGISQSSVARAEDLTYEEIFALVREAVELAGGLEGIVSDGDTVILKPNLVTMRCNTLPGWNGRPLPPEVNGNSTDYRVTRAVAVLVRELNPSGRIYVMEGSTQNTMEVFRAMNYTAAHIPEVDGFLAIETDSGTWQNTNSPGLVRVPLENALLHDAYYYNRRIFEADVLISIPTLKNHWHAVTTGGIKNLSIGNAPANIYGDSQNSTLRYRMVNHYNADLHRWIADYYTLRPADFVVMDALQGLDHGPTPSFDVSGIRNITDAQKNMRAVLASADGLAIDVVQTNIMNWDIDSVLYLQYLIEANRVGNGNSQNIVVRGVPVDNLRTRFEGVIPPAGGRRLPDTPTPPTVAISSAAFEGDTLRMQLNLSANTDKIDIYIDGIYVTSVHENMANISLNLQGLPNGQREITVHAFDRFMHGASAVTRVTK
jgi:uncharacterized protein (DUF362 family)